LTRFSLTFALENNLTPTNLNLRPIEIDDFSRFIKLQSEALLHAPEVFGSDYHWFESLSTVSKEQRYEKYLNFPYQYLLGAFVDENTLVGMVGFSVDNSQSKTRHKGKLWGLFVSPNHRGQGIATKLVETLISTARDVVQCEQIQLTVGTENQASYLLYLRLGFTVYGTERHSMKLVGGYADEFLMVKFL